MIRILNNLSTKNSLPLTSVYAALLIKWENNRSDRGRLESGVEEIHFMSSPSLALELHAICDGTVDAEFDYLKGGWCYLIGDPNIFWSLIIHKRTTGKILPPAQPGASWDDTYCANELLRMLSPLVDESSAAISTSTTPNPSHPVEKQSQSMAAISFIQLRHLRTHPMTLSAMVPCTQEDLPEWWTALEKFWGGALKRAQMDDIEGAPCMFYGRGVCKAAGCRHWHDDRWIRDMQKISQRFSERVSTQNS